VERKGAGEKLLEQKRAIGAKGEVKKTKGRRAEKTGWEKLG